ncbi:Tyrosine recombinase XerC [Botrimarina colliarenosi]|uniref:Tyrosine recombinase XerC n=1 Tax=Botrimarina colliarenosi TaxID=2528001 RepID=A0A5C6A9Y5_9BACT|nr:tyrosine-type recombinase/integrase [Botrimarina colliarenosi]TWT96128.1 Tyrosine recombinase XerC [Botrimarina colliarenosi]
MARRAKPWLRKGRGWYVQHHGKQIALGKDKAAAFLRYHELMQQGPCQAVAGDSFFAVCDAFLEWTHQHRAPRTYEWYVDRLGSFARSLSRSGGEIRIAAVRPLHVQQWLDENPRWGATTQRQAIVAVQRCFNWAERMGYLDRSPVRQIEKPRANVRETIIRPAEYAEILQTVGDDAFRDLLVVSWETGCRPQESLRVEGRHFDRANSRWVFPPSEAKGRRKPRLVYLPEASLAITQRRLSEFPTGPLFRNTAGRPWQAYAVNCRFQRLKKKLGRSHCLYQFRHSFATRMLESGLDALTVALLLGHSNPAMLSTTYQHLAHNPQHLLGQLSSATK